MKSKIIKRHLTRLINHLVYYNRLSPFPIYDTAYVQDVKDKLNNIMIDKIKDYDDEPVVACKYCKSLHIEYDELNNDVCMRCGSVNELVEFNNINEYNSFINDNKSS